jgi:small-conductance mechanosensitive channel
MLQDTPASPDPDTLLVAWEDWVSTAFSTDLLRTILVFALLAILLYGVVWLVRKQVVSQIEDINRRHIVRKWIGYVYFALLIPLAISLFAGALIGLGAFLAVLLAGLAVALQDILKSIVGWLYLSARSDVQVGSRMEVDGVRGDVIDIGVLKTTLLEVGNLVFGQQSTGRLVTIPNWRMLTSPVFISAADNLFVWQEIKVVVTFESDWERAEEILREIATEMYQEIAPELRRSYRSLERRYAFKHGADTPIVYVTMEDHGVALVLRYMTHVRRKRGGVDRVSRHVLEAFEKEPSVDLAYPTYRIYRAGEHALANRAISISGEASAPPLPPDS